MKGLELPINTLIIIVLAVLVLIAIIVLFSTGISMPKESVSLQTALNNACMELLNSNCNKPLQNVGTPYFDSDRDGVVGDVGVWMVICYQTPAPGAAGDNLYQLCTCWFQLNRSDPNFRNDCKKLCGCP